MSLLAILSILPLYAPLGTTGSVPVALHHSLRATEVCLTWLCRVGSLSPDVTRLQWVKDVTARPVTVATVSITTTDRVASVVSLITAGSNSRGRNTEAA